MEFYNIFHNISKWPEFRSSPNSISDWLSKKIWKCQTTWNKRAKKQEQKIFLIINMSTCCSNQIVTKIWKLIILLFSDYCDCVTSSKWLWLWDVIEMIEVSDTSDFLDKVASAEPPVNVLPSPRPSNKGGLLVQSGSMDGFYLVLNAN